MMQSSSFADIVKEETDSFTDEVGSPPNIVSGLFSYAYVSKDT